MRNSMRGASYPPLRAGDQMSDGQIMLSHGSLILWFSPEEFEEFCRLGATARQQLADAAPLPPLGLPWKLPHQGSQTQNESPLSCSPQRPRSHCPLTPLHKPLTTYPGYLATFDLAHTRRRRYLTLLPT